MVRLSFEQTGAAPGNRHEHHGLVFREKRKTAGYLSEGRPPAHAEIP